MNSSSSNTLERATNQQDILKEMIDDKEDQESHKSAIASQIVPEIPKEEIKIDNKPKLQLLKRKRIKNSHKNDVCSKSVSNIELSKDTGAKNIKKFDVSQIQLKPKIKKRPNSAKSSGKSGKDAKSDADTNKKLHEIFEKFKKFHENKSGKKSEDLKTQSLKPPISHRSVRNDKKDISHKSSESLSEKFSQLSPSNGDHNRKYLV